MFLYSIAFLLQKIYNFLDNNLLSYQSKYAFLLRENGKFKENQDSKNSGAFKLGKKKLLL